MTQDMHQVRNARTWSGLFRAIAIIGMVLAVGAQMTTAGVAAEESVSPEEALEQRERAQELLAELQRVNADPMMSAEPSTINSVRDRVQNGNLSYDRANYAEAENHWQVAQEQARAALQARYAAGTERSLNATADYLENRASDGYQSAQMSEYQERVVALRKQEPSSLEEHRQRYQAARKLHNDVDTSLPSSTVVDLANLLSPLWLSAPVGALVLGGVGVGAGIAGHRLGSEEEEDDEENNEPEDDSSRRF